MNVGSNEIAALTTVGVTYPLTSFVLNTLGVEAYGTWVLITCYDGVQTGPVIGSAT